MSWWRCLLFEKLSESVIGNQVDISPMLSHYLVLIIYQKFAFNLTQGGFNGKEGVFQFPLFPRRTQGGSDPELLGGPTRRGGPTFLRQSRVRER
jgi:hypothetical protein